MTEDIFICVDVEAAGPVPENYALLSIGACLVDDISINFYRELQPDRKDFVTEALSISGLKMEELVLAGTPPRQALQQFADWLNAVVPEGARPIFVALNAPFDWMFINEYFHRYLGHNPFGHSALDIKAYFMGQTGVDWSETSMKHLSEHFTEERHLTHNALRDAQDQAEIFQKILKDSPKYNRAE